MCLREQRGTLPLTVKAGSGMGCPVSPQLTIWRGPGDCWSMIWELLVTEGRCHIFFLLLLEKTWGEMMNPMGMGQLLPRHIAAEGMMFPGPRTHTHTHTPPVLLTTDCPGCALVSSLSLTSGEEFQKGSVLLSNLSVNLVSISETGQKKKKIR